jgi:hypothetical protein
MKWLVVAAPLLLARFIVIAQTPATVEFASSNSGILDDASRSRFPAWRWLGKNANPTTIVRAKPKGNDRGDGERAALVSLKHRQLMAQGDDLGLHCDSAPKTDKKGIEQH